MKEGSTNLPLPEQIDHVIALSTLKEHYQSEKEGTDRLANLDELINAAASFIAEERLTEEGNPQEHEDVLAAFLAHASLEAGEHQAGEGDDALQLMTVHSAKGLEFNIVFLSGLEEGLFPHENSAMELDGVEEERRLMYVAITRARQRLYLSFAQTRMLHGQTRYNAASRFLEEVPPALLKWLKPSQAKGFAGNNSGYSAPAYHSAAPARRESPGGLRIGLNVRHAKFGQGVVIGAEGGGTDARVQVNFGAAGIKWLALSVAKLDIL
jgi:DNA helicase-2/ATP-dependent DNA helicase PcrA